ncbi:DUF6950 family protein [Sphingomonas sp.]|uniref:DUF6950 family protein n=1 Tax=Sphingomonas sp. TaxID=28214 RepID=UPI003BA90205
MTALGEFLRNAALDRSPWNCSTMPADWCMSLGFPDFAAQWRGIVDPAECEAAPAEAGGLAILWARGIADGLDEATAPFMPGDIGVISLYGFEGGGIYTGDKWALRRPRGVVCSQIPDSAIIAAWRPWAR